MSCPIHDRCTCCSAPFQYTASIGTTTGSSQFAPQSIFGYEWASPLVSRSGGPWHTVDPVTFHPSSTSYTGQDLSQPDSYHPRNTYESMPLHLMHQREARAYAHEQKQALPSHEPVSVVVIVTVSSPDSYSSIRDAAPTPHPIHPRDWQDGNVQQLLRSGATSASFASW